jgi:NAD(P)-dependent dehydrogenase (short-subunit alcohol dehydrogenase family)
MATVLITGANRGLGLEFTRQYLAAGDAVIAVCRDPANAGALQALKEDGSPVEIVETDVSDLEAIEHLARQVGTRPIDVLINNAGLYGPRAQRDNNPGQTFGHVDYAAWEDVFRVNTRAPLRFCEVFIENVAASKRRTIATVTSRMGSIGDGSTDCYIYRSTKAALNMVMATLARELRPQGIKVALLHPGWVRTAMGGAQALIDAETSVRGMRQQIDGITPETSGRFVDYTGKELPW